MIVEPRQEQARRIVVVDDDDLFRESLTRNLADAGFAVAEFNSGATALAHFGREGSTDLAILDWRMPAMSGIELLRRMREEGTDIPVIFLTALTDQIYEEAALATGAVDFVDKSRGFGIVLKRIQLILEGSKSPAKPGEPESEIVTKGHLTLKLKTGRATWRDRPVELTLTEFRMVELLVGQAGEDVGYRALYDVVHGNGFCAGTGPEGYRANVRTFIKRIRQKFREIDPEFDEIENYAGFGYRWKARRGR